MKFGGTSVEGATAFKNAARIVFDRQALRPVVVVSAMAGFTDALIDRAQQAFRGNAETGAANISGDLERHFDRHLRVIDALLTTEAPRMLALVDQSRAEISELLRTFAQPTFGQMGKPEVTNADPDSAINDVNDLSGRRRRKFFEDAIVSYGERLSAAMLAAVLIENGVSEPRR